MRIEQILSEAVGGRIKIESFERLEVTANDRCGFGFCLPSFSSGAVSPGPIG
jgi:hypothetical protein